MEKIIQLATVHPNTTNIVDTTATVKRKNERKEVCDPHINTTTTRRITCNISERTYVVGF